MIQQSLVCTDLLEMEVVQGNEMQLQKVSEKH